MKKTIAALLLTTALMPISAQAGYDKNEFVIGIQAWDIGDSDNGGFRFEHRLEELSTDYTFGLENISPFYGVDISFDAAVYGYGGFLYDIELSDTWSLQPNVAVGGYNRGIEDRGNSLGGVVNFRSGLELNYKLCENSRIGLSFHHYSNASIYDENPGMENIALVYSFSF